MFDLYTPSEITHDVDYLKIVTTYSKEKYSSLLTQVKQLPTDLQHSNIGFDAVYNGIRHRLHSLQTKQIRNMVQTIGAQVQRAYTIIYFVVMS
jgi:hypothetical protein